MYGPKWPFLFMYESHAMRQTGFPRVDGLSTDPWVLGHHMTCRIPYRIGMFLLECECEILSECSCWNVNVKY